MKIFETKRFYYDPTNRTSTIETIKPLIRLIDTKYMAPDEIYQMYLRLGNLSDEELSKEEGITWQKNSYSQ